MAKYKRFDPRNKKGNKRNKKDTKKSNVNNKQNKYTDELYYAQIRTC